jgi:hypothetical protein
VGQVGIRLDAVDHDERDAVDVVERAAKEARLADARRSDDDPDGAGAGAGPVDEGTQFGELRLAAEQLRVTGDSSERHDATLQASIARGKAPRAR